MTTEDENRRSDPPNHDWSADEIRRVGYHVIDLIADHLTKLPARPVFRPFPKAAATAYLSSEPPEFGQSPDEILTAFETDIAPFPFGNGHPRFYGWVNSPPTTMGIFADALAAAMNPSCAGGNHAAIYVEREVINWFKKIIGFPSEAMGLLTSGGSMAALTALAVARHVKCGFDVRADGLQRAAQPLTFYRSGEAHGCHQKAIELMGIGHLNLKIVPHNRAQGMIPMELERAISQDKANGCKPVAVIASAGTVNTGAIDPLDEIADVCAQHDVWLHVDGAYGAPAILTPKYASRLAGLSRADSVALDPHKWLYVPVEAGLVLIRNATAMRQTFSLIPPYLRTDGKVDGVGGPPWFSEYGYQQTRGFRALKVWMAMRYHGLAGYRRLIENDIALAEHLAANLRSASDFELLEPQNLSIVCFRFRPPKASGDSDAINAWNRDILEQVQLGGRVFLSSTVIDKRFWLRACMINPRASAADLDSLMEVIRETAQQVSSQ
jgi:aromatic-L-amino-acid/L-tryptophan decarboxylase